MLELPFIPGSLPYFLPLHWALLSTVTLGSLVCKVCLSRSSCTKHSVAFLGPVLLVSLVILKEASLRLRLARPGIELYGHLLLTEVESLESSPVNKKNIFRSNFIPFCHCVIALKKKKKKNTKLIQLSPFLGIRTKCIMI